jgi:uncharacterized membrane protein
MLNAIVYGCCVLILLMLTIISWRLAFMEKNAKQDEDELYKEKIELSKSFVYAAILLTIGCIIGCSYLLLKGTVYEGHLTEWLNIGVRVMHITFGIAWIGASFYFVFLENALNRTKDVREELAGNLWAVHGGGFYYLEKYKVAPKVIPKELHWFKYEAYFTWLSGFCLLFVVYYFNAKATLIDDNVMKLTAWQGIGIGVGSFIIAWIVYDLLCKTRLVKNANWFGIVGFVLLIGFAWFYAHVFNSRAAYIHFGAMIGSIMVGNVFFVIIPSQKAMVKAAKEGQPLNPQLGKNALQRSLHNNYFTLPVLFVMVSNHFPSTFGNDHSWALLAAISLGAAGIKHWLNVRERGQYNIWVLPVSVLLLLGVAYVSAPAKPGECKQKVSFAEVNTIITNRCMQCHSSKPTDDVYTAPPNGVVYDVPQNIVNLKDKIMQRVVLTKSMPQNNKTNMTPAERDLIRCWIEQGASLK